MQHGGVLAALTGLPVLALVLLLFVLLWLLPEHP